MARTLDEHWIGSRAGATAGRGYHYQDLVGALIGLRILAGEISAEALTPEGLDDMTCDGASPQQVQVKSRQQRIGGFRIADAAQHVVDSWQRSVNRAAVGEAIIVVLERPVAGYAPSEWQQPIGGEAAWSDLVVAARSLATRRGLSPDDVDALVLHTAVVVLPQQLVFAKAAALVARRTGLPLGATLPVLQAVRAAVAECADKNAEASWTDRATLTRTDLERIVLESAALVDRGSLSEAIASGSCQPIDFDAALSDPDFYSGSSTQPGHVAAGLVVARPGPTDEVLAGLATGKAVLVAGPSGVGKSAVMWMACYVARHVVWYQVHRLREEDVDPLLRLARAAGAGRYGPVGLVVDGVGTGTKGAWDHLHERAAAMPGVLLLGSVREEDTLPLESIGDCVVLRPRLDEELAARIHQALVDSAASSEAHWREAFDATEGLTLEFTHLLTQGQRLREVVGDQIRTRVRARRGVELAVLAPVSAADRWQTELTIDALTELVAASPHDLQAALARLVDEHLVTVSHGTIRGLHPLRSAAICDAVHAVPPPTLAATLSGLVQRVGADQLAALVARAIADEPGVGEAIVDALAAHLNDGGGDVVTTAAALAGLRLADFTATARRWVSILDQHDVATPHRPLALDLGMIDTDLVSALDERLIAAVQDIRNSRNDAISPLRDRLLDRLVPDAIASAVGTASDPLHAAALLAPLAQSGLEIAPATPRTLLEVALRDGPLEDVAELIATAASVSPSTGKAFLDAAGGSQRMLERLREAHPWLLDLDIVGDDGDNVLRGRVLHVGDRFSSSPERSIKSLASLGLRCLPHVARADLTTVLAGGLPLIVNGFELATSGLLRQYAPSANAIAWNRSRSRLARSLVGAPTATARLAAGRNLLEQTADFLADLADAWVTNKGAGQRLARLNRRRSDLIGQIDRLAPQRTQQPLGGPDDAPGGTSDPIHGVAQAIVRNLPLRLQDPSGYRSLAAFTGDTIRRLIDDAAKEPWGLLGLGAPPPVIAKLAELVSEIHKVLAELAFGDMTAAHVSTATRGLSRGAALSRAARMATARAQRRYDATTSALVEHAMSQGLTLEVRSRQDPDAQGVAWPPIETAIIADVDAVGLDTVLTAMPDLLDRFTLPGSSVVVIPKRKGFAVPRYAIRVFVGGNAYPESGAAKDWLDEATETRPTPCADAVSDAIEALQELSGIAYFDANAAATPTVRQAANESADRLLDALDRLRSLPQDSVTNALVDAIAELADQVQDELHGGSVEFLAGRVAKAITGENPDAVQDLVGLTSVATEWDIDPAATVALIDKS